jgi:hypothetical protein
MLKKSLILCILTFVCFCLSRTTKAESNYLHFQQIDLSEGKLLSDFTDEEYKKYYEKVKKRKFWGWKTYYVNENVRVKYISETIFSYYNHGTSIIKYDYSLEESDVSKLSISGTGSIGYTLSGSKNSFKHGLDTALKLDASYSSTVTSEEKTKLNIEVEPNTVANLKIVGEGRISNGVAARYILWIRMNIGGFEYFLITTQYPRLEVLPI